METQPKMGMNRTGIAMSPIDVQKMIKDTDAIMGTPITPRLPTSPIRSSYLTEAEQLGTIPLPLSIKGVAESGKALLTGNHPQILIDQLGARLAFERGGVRLYQAMLAKCEAQPQALAQDVVAELSNFQDQELEHFHWLEEAMRALGADPTAVTPCADLVGVKSMGLMQAITDPRTTVFQSLEVLLAAELLDVPAWEDLIILAKTLGHDDLTTRFEQALLQENNHLITVRQWCSDMALTMAQQGVASLGHRLNKRGQGWL
jgi:ferritin-like protein